jgi:hypothetical protein
VHRRTVRQALASAVPPERKQVERPSPVLDAWKPLIQVWVTTDEALPENLVGAAGGLGGFLPPIVMGLVYQATGDYAIGLMLLSDVALAGLVYTAWRLGVRGGARPRGRPG